MTDQEKFAAYVEFTLTDDHKSNPVLTFGEWLNAGKPEAPAKKPEPRKMGERDAESELICELAAVLDAYGPQQSITGNTMAVSALLKCAAAVVLGAVDKGWLSSVKEAELCICDAASGAMETVQAVKPEPRK